MRPTELINFNTENNAISRRLVDGRMIWAHILWVEPVIERCHRANLELVGRRNQFAMPATDNFMSAAASMLRCGLVDATSVRDLANQSPKLPANIPVTALADLRPAAQLNPLHLHEDSPLLRTVVAAHQRLSDLGLAYLADLTIGWLLVIDGAIGMDLDLAAVAVIEANEDVLSSAYSLCRSAAVSWLDCWLEAETAVGAPWRPPDDSVRRFVRDLFVDEISTEFWSRVGEEAQEDNTSGPDDDLVSRAESNLALLRRKLLPMRPGLPDKLVECLGISISAEMLCYMYPHWDKMQFCYGSPFDYMADLRPLTDEEIAAYMTRIKMGRVALGLAD